MSWQNDPNAAWNPPQTPAGPASPQQPYPQQPYGQQPYPAQPYPPQPYPAQPYPAQPYPQQPHAPQPYAQQPYPQQPYGWGAPRPLRYEGASLALLVVSIVVTVGSVVAFVAGIVASQGDPYQAGYLTGGPLISFLVCATVLGLTIGGRHKAAAGSIGLLRAAAIVAMVDGGLTVMNSVARIATLLGVAGLIGGLLFIAAGIVVVRIPSA